MTETEISAAAGPSLRERKKVRTRGAIQEQAIRLFREQGYDETTVEEVAAAADVSPSTVFRYFPTKADLVIYDDLDERMFEGYRSQPPELNAVQALRATLRSSFGSVLGSQLAVQRERERLLRSVPELRAAMLDELTRTIREAAVLVAERAGRSPDDDEVLALSGAMVGLTIAAWFATEGGDQNDRFVERLDRGFEMLETGFSF